jgi:hypothetical protein
MIATLATGGDAGGTNARVLIANGGATNQTVTNLTVIGTSVDCPFIIKPGIGSATNSWELWTTNGGLLACISSNGDFMLGTNGSGGWRTVLSNVQAGAKLAMAYYDAGGVLKFAVGTNGNLGVGNTLSDAYSIICGNVVNATGFHISSVPLLSSSDGVGNYNLVLGQTGKPTNYVLLGNRYSSNTMLYVSNRSASSASPGPPQLSIVAASTPVTPSDQTNVYVGIATINPQYNLDVGGPSGMRVGSNLVMMTAISSPTVSGTNNGIFWASNNTLFWRWTAGGTTTNEVKIAGP